MQAGVYKITNKVNGKFYIGSSFNVRNRKYSHFSCLRLNKHSNKHLQNAYNKYGASNFVYEIICICDSNNTFTLEQFYIDLLKPQYNIREIAINNSGFKHTRESIDKITRVSRKKWEENPSRLPEFNKKAIICYDKYGSLIKEYDSAKSASEDLGIFSTNITCVLKGKINTIKGYHFIYKNGKVLQKIVIPLDKRKTRYKKQLKSKKELELYLKTLKSKELI